MMARQLNTQKHKLKAGRRDPYSTRHTTHSQSPLTNNIRVVQSHLVYVIGLKPEICTEEILSSREYFGKYGTVLKVVINKNGSTNRRYVRDISYAAHITYEDEVAAALAVISLFKFKYEEFTMRSCFGYTKYCDNFFYGRDCHNNNCVYLHRFHEQNEIPSSHGSERDNDNENFRKQKLMALKTVYYNRRQIIQAAKDDRDPTNHFPDSYESMRGLVDEGYMSDDEYEMQWEMQDTIKCYTESTETSPLKEEEFDSQKQKREVSQGTQSAESSQEQNSQWREKGKDKDKWREGEDYKVQKKNRDLREYSEQKQQNRPLQNQPVSCELEQNLGKVILRALRNKNRHNHSRFDFARTLHHAHRDLKDIFQREFLFRI